MCREFNGFKNNGLHRQSMVALCTVPVVRFWYFVGLRLENCTYSMVLSCPGLAPPKESDRRLTGSAEMVDKPAGWQHHLYLCSPPVCFGLTSVLCAEKLWRIYGCSWSASEDLQKALSATHASILKVEGRGGSIRMARLISAGRGAKQGPDPISGRHGACPRGCGVYQYPPRHAKHDYVADGWTLRLCNRAGTLY